MELHPSPQGISAMENLRSGPVKVNPGCGGVNERICSIPRIVTRLCQCTKYVSFLKKKQYLVYGNEKPSVLMLSDEGNEVRGKTGQIQTKCRSPRGPPSGFWKAASIQYVLSTCDRQSLER